MVVTEDKEGSMHRDARPIGIIVDQHKLMKAIARIFRLRDGDGDETTWKSSVLRLTKVFVAIASRSPDLVAQSGLNPEAMTVTIVNDTRVVSLIDTACSYGIIGIACQKTRTLCAEMAVYVVGIRLMRIRIAVGAIQKGGQHRREKSPRAHSGRHWFSRPSRFFWQLRAGLLVVKD